MALCWVRVVYIKVNLVAYSVADTGELMVLAHNDVVRLLTNKSWEMS